jgi:hypothetical protein
MLAVRVRKMLGYGQLKDAFDVAVKIENLPIGGLYMQIRHK